MEQKERYAESYKITQAIHIGTSEIVIGIDMKAKDNMYYMVADYENNGIFEKYNNRRSDFSNCIGKYYQTQHIIKYLYKM